MKKPSRILAAALAVFHIASTLALADPTSFQELLRRYKETPTELREEAADDLAASIWSGQAGLSYEEGLEVLAGEMRSPEDQALLAPVARSLEGIWEAKQPPKPRSASAERFEEMWTSALTGGAIGGMTGIGVTLLSIASGTAVAAALPAIAAFAGLGILVGVAYGALKVLNNWKKYGGNGSQAVRNHSLKRPSKVIPVRAATASEVMAREGEADVRSEEAIQPEATEPSEDDCTDVNGVPALDCLEVAAVP